MNLEIRLAERKDAERIATLATARAWAVSRGVSKLRLKTRSTRPEAHAFYEHLGFALDKEQRVYDLAAPRSE